MDVAKGFGKYLSVVKDARIAVDCGVTAMHDITEGGVFGALWRWPAARAWGWKWI